MSKARIPQPYPRDQSERLAWLNSSGETIPAFACVKLFSYDDATNQFQADKPDGSPGLYYANGPATVATDKYSGSGMWNLPRRCLLDDDTYEVGDEVGPVSGQWGMGSDGSGWLVLRPPNADKEAVVQVMGGGGSGIRHGIVNEVIGCGYYRIELSDWIGETPDSGNCGVCEGLLENVDIIGTVASGDDAGDPIYDCDQAVGDLPVFDLQTEGNTEIVLAYDPASVYVPLKVNTDCLLTDLGDKNAVAGSEDEEACWQIVRGQQEHIVQYRERWECCNGEYVLVAKTPVVFAGIECPEMRCEDC